MISLSDMFFALIMPIQTPSSNGHDSASRNWFKSETQRRSFCFFPVPSRSHIWRALGRAVADEGDSVASSQRAPLFFETSCNRFRSSVRSRIRVVGRFRRATRMLCGGCETAKPTCKMQRQHELARLCRVVATAAQELSQRATPSMVPNAVPGH